MPEERRPDPDYMAQLSESWPADLKEYVDAEAGHPVRCSETDELPGRCGGRTSNGTYCRYAAGRGTDHKGVGRCSEHPDLYNGLPPWIGEVPRDKWLKMTGGREEKEPETGQFAVTHGATKASLKPHERAYFAQMTPEQQQVFLNAVDDPVELTKFMLKALQVDLNDVRSLENRIWAAHGRSEWATLDRLASTRTGIIQISTIMARWNEGAIRLKEFGEDEKTGAALREVLAALTHEELARVRRDPALLGHFMKS